MNRRQLGIALLVAILTFLTASTAYLSYVRAPTYFATENGGVTYFSMFGGKQDIVDEKGIVFEVNHPTSIFRGLFNYVEVMLKKSPTNLTMISVGWLDKQDFSTITDPFKMTTYSKLSVSGSPYVLTGAQSATAMIQLPDDSKTKQLLLQVEVIAFDENRSSTSSERKYVQVVRTYPIEVLETRYLQPEQLSQLQTLTWISWGFFGGLLWIRRKNVLSPSFGFTRGVLILTLLLFTLLEYSSIIGDSVSIQHFHNETITRHEYGRPFVWFTQTIDYRIDGILAQAADWNYFATNTAVWLFVSFTTIWIGWLIKTRIERRIVGTRISRVKRVILVGSGLLVLFALPVFLLSTLIPAINYCLVCSFDVNSAVNVITLLTVLVSLSVSFALIINGLSTGYASKETQQTEPLTQPPSQTPENQTGPLN